MWNRVPKCAVVVALAIAWIATPLRADDVINFAKRIKEAVDPHFDGEQFGEGTIPRTMEDRYNNTFQQAPAPFDSMFSSDDVGGILLRSHPQKPVKVLHLNSATFRIENGAVDTVLFRLNTDSKPIEFRVPATLVPAAALMAADKRLVLLTLSAGSGQGLSRSHVELAAAHPAIAKHQLAYMAARLDLSLQNVMEGHGRNYLLCEKGWRLSPKAFSTREDLFTVRCRIGLEETTPMGITETWGARLGDDEKQWFGVLNDFVVVHRLVRAVMDRYIAGFPENDFVQLLKQLQPIYEKHKMTREQVDALRVLLMAS